MSMISVLGSGLPQVVSVCAWCPALATIFSEGLGVNERLQPHPSLTHTQLAFRLVCICAFHNSPIKRQMQLPETPFGLNLEKSISFGEGMMEVFKR